MPDDSSRRTRLLQHFETVFDALPPLNSEAFRTLLRSASIDDLPAQVLLRAYVVLGGQGPSARLAATRLLDAWDVHEDPGPHAKGYLAHIHTMAERRVEGAASPYTAVQYVSETGRQILRAMRRECAHAQATGARCRITNWFRFCEDRFKDALNALDGKRNKKTKERTKVARLRALPHPVTGQPVVENLGGDGAPWHVSAGPTLADIETEDLLAFLRRVLRSTHDALMVDVAEHLWFSADPPPISKPDADGREPLTDTLNTTRGKIRHACDRSRALIKAAVLAEFGSTSAEYRLVERLTDTSKPQHHVRLSR